jgi:hypothetical protein
MRIIYRRKFMKKSKEDGIRKEKHNDVCYTGMWKQFWGSLRKGSQVHHIIPLSVGGITEIGNIIELHPDDHKLIHEMRGDTISANGCFLKVKNFKRDNSYLKGNTHKTGKKESLETRKRKSRSHTVKKRSDHSEFMKSFFTYEKYFPEEVLKRKEIAKKKRRNEISKEKGFDNFLYFSLFVQCHLKKKGYMTQIQREYNIPLSIVREAKNYKLNVQRRDDVGSSRL